MSTSVPPATPRRRDTQDSALTDVSAFCVSPFRAISYGPLSITGNEIRILVLEPPSPEETRIRGRLEHASLFDLNNDFVALSYYWGDHNALKRIILNGDLIPITFNLYKALSELRRRGLYRVWVDDLCINQYDDEERGRQVLRMGSIYRSASLVFAHLRGPGLSWQQALFEAVQRITRRADTLKRVEKQQARMDAKREAWQRKKSTRSRSMDEETRYLGINQSEVSLRSADRRHSLDLSAAEETALFLFLDSPYWRRAWIIQEIAVNPRLTVVWGRQAFDLSQVIQAFSLLSHYVSGKREKIWNHIKCLYKIRTSQLALKPLSLVDALGLCYLAKAQFIRDHVFALLGLTHDGSYLVPFPSYALPQEDISRDMTIRLIRATGSFDVVVSKGQQGGGGGGEGTEPWYPNWFDSKYWHAYRLSHLRLGRPSLLTHTSYGAYRASGHHTPSFRVHDHALIARGFFLGSLVDCSPTLDEAKASDMPRNALLRPPRAWKRNVKNDERLFVGPGPAEIMRTLCWLLIDITRPPLRAKDHHNNNNNHHHHQYDPQQRRTGEHLYTLLHTLLRRGEEVIAERVPSLLQWLNCCEAQCFKVGGRRLTSYFSMKSGSGAVGGVGGGVGVGGVAAPLSPTDRDTLEQDCMTMQRNLRAGLRLAVTDAGALGWVPRNARVGDHVAILLGASTPCVLRPRHADADGGGDVGSDGDGGGGGESYTVVGQCIIDGVMKGEAVRKGVQRLQDIELH